MQKNNIKTNRKFTDSKLFKKTRSIVESVLTDKQIRIVKQYIYKNRLNKAYKFDQKIYSNNSFGFVPEYTLDNLRGKITLHYHSIEKGMSNPNIRLGFGKAAFRDLFYSLDTYIDMNFPLDDERFLSAINIIKAYVEYHDAKNFKVEPVKKKLEEYLEYYKDAKENKSKGNRSVNKDEILNSLNSSFDTFAKSRMSIRNYDNTKVDLNLVKSAIDLAKYTPSVCNRQPWKVYIIENKEKIINALNIQKGLNEVERNNVPLLLAVTVDTSYFSSDKERNEPFVDGGLFSMSLLYSLHHYGLAACALNANMSNNDLIQEHKLLNINSSERIIMFISVGNYNNKVIAPISARDDVEEYITYI